MQKKKRKKEKADYTVKQWDWKELSEVKQLPAAGRASIPDSHLWEECLAFASVIAETREEALPLNNVAEAAATVLPSVQQINHLN